LGSGHWQLSALSKISWCVIVNYKKCKECAMNVMVQKQLQQKIFVGNSADSLAFVETEIEHKTPSKIETSQIWSNIEH
jgi:hypothetical protein